MDLCVYDAQFEHELPVESLNKTSVWVQPCSAIKEKISQTCTNPSHSLHPFKQISRIWVQLVGSIRKGNFGGHARPQHPEKSRHGKPEPAGPPPLRQPLWRHQSHRWEGVDFERERPIGRQRAGGVWQKWDDVSVQFRC